MDVRTGTLQDHGARHSRSLRLIAVEVHGD